MVLDTLIIDLNSAKRITAVTVVGGSVRLASSHLLTGRCCLPSEPTELTTRLCGAQSNLPGRYCRKNREARIKPFLRACGEFDPG